ncbi:MAG: hypothetical protein WC310_03785 [Patescibacteria group bacterium]|jgi:uncharacterized membrane protein YhaH (DUF805 family)
MTNERLIRNIELASDESVQMIVRRYLLIYWWQILLVIIFLLLPFFLLYPLLQWDTWGPVIFSLLLAFSLYYLCRFYVKWYFGCLVVTSQRLIDFDQRGMFDRTVSPAPLDLIEDLGYQRRGFFQSILKYGTVHYSLPQGQARIIIFGIKNPQNICQKIELLITDARNHRLSRALNVDQRSIGEDDAVLGRKKDGLEQENFKKTINEIRSLDDDQI